MAAKKKKAATKKRVLKKNLVGRGPPAPVPSNPAFSFRVDPAEKELFQAAAEADGFNSLGTWVKWLCRRRVAWQEREQA